MSQFVAYANADPVSEKLIPYFLDVQSNLIETIGSRVVVPLVTVERAGGVMERLMPSLLVGDRHMVMDTPQVMGVPMRMLGKQAADLSHERDAILAAIDMLTHGI
ncbi:MULTISPECIES: CcdB family protein [unclassified Luteimonas]|uniref:CcdB family protein n=1 Tax=unclassified Luteimonas TaxID=2629088 RepID=UPI0018F07924|nr:MULTISPECIES: CcdB family protein [unclassified Luteimonas]MBJ6981360.1 CcdB family protein [Luteimonas sp. MC1572]MBJ7576065.1 CcdB family protein [Luteimonas sp. MC1828]QQO02674.1 CcdB family protein [Luteimonas sp. MC1572]